MAGASCLAIECQASRIEMRLKTGYVDLQAKDLDDALATIERATAEKKAVSVRASRQRGPSCLPELVRRGVRPDCVTDQTSAHDPVNGYLPKGWTLAEWEAAARARSERGHEGREALHGRACPRHARLPPHGRAGRRLRQQHPPDGFEEGVADAFDFRLRAGLYPPALLPRHRAVRWCALSGDPEDIYRTDAKVKELMPGASHLHNWLDMAKERIRFQGLPRASAGRARRPPPASASPSTRWSRAAS
jgi:urocanate hydratase